MSVLLDVGIGLIVVFLIFSIVVSGVNEWVAQAFGRRGEFMRIGLQRLINDQAVFFRVLHHPLIGSLYRDRAAQGKPPSYVDPQNFALAISDVLLARAGARALGAVAIPITVSALQAGIRSPALRSSPINAALSPILDRSAGNLEAALAGIQGWFNSGMDRVQGWYKARTHRVLFYIGLGIAAACNVDTIEIFQALNHSAPLRASFVSSAQQIVATGKVGDVGIADTAGRALTPDEVAGLQHFAQTLLASSPPTLPIGYACLGLAKLGDTHDKAANPWLACKSEWVDDLSHRSLSAWISKLVGWVLTALAGTLGANYWFQILSKAINIRDSGSKPPGSSANASAPGPASAVVVTNTSAGGSPAYGLSQPPGALSGGVQGATTLQADADAADGCSIPIDTPTPDEALPAARGGVG